MNDGWHSYKTFNLKKHLWDIRSFFSHKYWYDWDITASWRLAEQQCKFFSNPANGYLNVRTLTIKSASQIAVTVWNNRIQKGDLLYFAKKNGKRVYHATMIAKVEKGKIYYTAHSRSRWEYDLSKSIGSDQVIIVRIHNGAR